MMDKSEEEKFLESDKVMGVDVAEGEDQAVQASFEIGADGNLHLVDEEQVKRWPDKWIGLLS